MKLRLLLIATLVMAGMLEIHSQETALPFVKEGKVWNCQADEIAPRSYSYVIEGDTVYARTGEWYKKVWVEDEQVYGDKQRHYFGAVRQEGDYVYLLPRDAAKEQLLYDFGIRQGGILSYPYGEDVFYLSFQSASEETVNGTAKRVVSFNPYFDSWDDTRVFEVVKCYEGIGFEKDPFDVAGGYGKGSHQLVSCIEDGACIYGEGIPAGITEFYPQGTTWEESSYYHYSQTDMLYIYMRYTVSGDTIVDGTPYKRVAAESKILDSYAKKTEFGGYYLSETDDFTWDNEGPYHWEDAPSFNFCLREENGNVYVRKASFGNEERKMYDFNWEEGKQVEEWHPTVGNVTHTLEGIQQTALLDGTTELALPNSPYQFETIGTIRGIGYLKGLFGDFGAADMWGGPGAFDLPLRQFDHVVKFTRGGILLYEWNPMDVSGIQQIRQDTANTDADGAKYSVSGIRIGDNTPLPRGIYIQAGKKRVAGR